MINYDKHDKLALKHLSQRNAKATEPNLMFLQNSFLHIWLPITYL